jgi:hypothetical protein
MESQQIVELLLSMQARMKTNQDDLLKTVKEKMQATIGKTANRKIDRKETTACQYAIETILKNMESNSGEKETAVEQQEISNEEVAVHSPRTCRSETAASQEGTKTEPEPGTMQSMEEHQEIPKEKAVVKPIKGRKKRHRDRKPAAGRRGEPDELTRGDCGSGKKLAAACKKITHRATVAWRKRNVLRKTVTQGNCGPRSTLTAAGIMMTRHARVALRRENFVRKDCTRAQDERVTQRVGPLRKNLPMHHEGKCGEKKTYVTDSRYT